MSLPAYSPRPGLSTAEMIDRTRPGAPPPPRFVWVPGPPPSRSPGICADTLVAWAVLAILYGLVALAVVR